MYDDLRTAEKTKRNLFYLRPIARQERAHVKRVP